MPSALWKAPSVDAWASTWAKYHDVVKSLQKDKLVELDQWFQSELPKTLHERDPAPYVTQKEMIKLMEWKLKKGKWRPQLMKFVTSLSDKDVKDASTKALKELKSGHVKPAVEALSALKGIGPATASAVLAAYDPKVPFMGDEALEAIASIIGPRKYTLSHYMSFHDELKKKAAWLSSQAGDNAADWTPQRVQLCLYAEANGGKASPKAAEAKQPAGSKRKAPAAQEADEAEDTKSPSTRRTRRKTSNN